MPDPTTLAIFAAAAFAVVASPGPAVFYVVTRSLDSGRRGGFASVFGIASGELVHVLAAIVGISALLASSAIAFSVVKYVGAAYLIWLGVRRIAGKGHDSLESSVWQSSRRTYVQGFVISVLNPKAALFFLSFLPQFVNPENGSVALQTAVLGVCYIAVAMTSDSAYVMVASALRRRLVPRLRTMYSRTRWVTGGTLIGLGISAAMASPSSSK